MLAWIVIGLFARQHWHSRVGRISRRATTEDGSHVNWLWPMDALQPSPLEVARIYENVAEFNRHCIAARDLMSTLARGRLLRSGPWVLSVLFVHLAHVTWATAQKE